MTSDERERGRAAARRRLSAESDVDDLQVAGRALADLFAKIRKRGPVSDEEAAKIAADEAERMRIEKRAPGSVNSGPRRK